MNYIDDFHRYHVVSAYWHGMGPVRKALLWLLHPKVAADSMAIARTCDEVDMELFGHTKWQEVLDAR